MQSLLKFLFRYKSIILFLVLEVLCVFLIVSNNSYQGSSFFNSSNIITGRIFETTNNIKYYFNLKAVNSDLAIENNNLRHLLEVEKQKNYLFKEQVSDTARIYQYRFVNGRVINNATNNLSNYFTIDKGTVDGIEPGMGVISTNGAVAGRIKSCSRYYSTALSVLNDKWPISAKIKKNNGDCIVEWKGGDPTVADLTHVGKHHKISLGDTVITSGFMEIFPYGIMIGKIKSIEDKGNKYLIKIDLTTDFTSISYVSILKNKLTLEKDTLQNNIPSTPSNETR